MPRDEIPRTLDAGALQSLVEQLTDELVVVREALDELREEVAWSLRNLMDNLPPQPPTILSSMPADPTAQNWAERLNRFSGNGDSYPLPTLSARAFSSPEGTAVRIRFCCERPELEWVGDADDPSIVCAACGEIVAVLPESRTDRQIREVMARHQAAVESTAFNQATSDTDIPRNPETFQPPDQKQGSLFT